VGRELVYKGERTKKKRQFLLLKINQKLKRKGRKREPPPGTVLFVIWKRGEDRGLMHNHLGKKTEPEKERKP